MSHVFPIQNVFREDEVTNGDESAKKQLAISSGGCVPRLGVPAEDEVTNGDESAKTLQNAPSQKDNMFIVPKTFD